jgi:NAD-reducing hydrogenase large subunit
MSRPKKIELGPLTRVEGHGKISIYLDEKGDVSDAKFHVTEFRGFEKFCEGRMLWDMPVVTTRICGICPVSHHLAAAKACDDLLGITVPPAARKLRELMHMGQFINSHGMHFFFLAAPDFILGPDSDPQKRGIVGICEKNPDLARKAIRLRKIGQDIVDKVGGRPIHPVTAIPGGMSRSLSHADRFDLANSAKEAVGLAQLAVETAYGMLDSYSKRLPSLGNFSTRHMGMVSGGSLELYDGPIKVIEPDGSTAEEFDGKDYLSYIGEHVEDSSWLKFPFLRQVGWPKGTYRVGPLARLNVSDSVGTPLAAARFASFKGAGIVQENLYYHISRTIELLYACERTLELLQDDDLVSKEVRVRADRKAGEGVGVIEAPRGTLFHHYRTDEDGRITGANFIVATAHNNKAIDRSVKEAAKTFVTSGRMKEGILNRIEMAVRCYDPCLSCSTHAIGEMPVEIRLYSHDGALIDILERTAPRP